MLRPSDLQLQLGQGIKNKFERHLTVFLWAEVQSVHPDGTDESELLIIPETDLEAWLPMVAVLECSTWGEVKALGPEIYREVPNMDGYSEFAGFIANVASTGQAPGLTPGPKAMAEWAAKQEEEVPTADQELEAYNDAPMVADGDWPPHINVLMAENLPAEVLKEHATWTYTSFNVDFAQIPLARKEAVLTTLARLRHTHRSDERVYRRVNEW